MNKEHEDCLKSQEYGSRHCIYNLDGVCSGVLISFGSSLVHEVDSGQWP